MGAAHRFGLTRVEAFSANMGRWRISDTWMEPLAESVPAATDACSEKAGTTGAEPASTEAMPHGFACDECYDLLNDDGVEPKSAGAPWSSGTKSVSVWGTPCWTTSTANLHGVRGVRRTLLSSRHLRADGSKAQPEPLECSAVLA